MQLTAEKIEKLVLQLEDLTPKTGKPSAKSKKAQSILVSSKEEVREMWKNLSPTTEQKLRNLWKA